MNPLSPRIPKLPPLPLQFSLPAKSVGETTLRYTMRLCVRVAALALMVICLIPAMLFAATSLTLHKWSQDRQ